jgi:hypothetical protein
MSTAWTVHAMRPIVRSCRDVVSQNRSLLSLSISLFLTPLFAVNMTTAEENLFRSEAELKLELVSTTCFKMLRGPPAQTDTGTTHRQ